MAIKKYYVANKKPGFQYDPKENKYFSWGYDAWLSGARVQERGFTSKKDAEAAVAKKRLEEKDARHGFAPPKEAPTLIELFQKKLNDLSGYERVFAKRVFEYFLRLDDVPGSVKVIELKTAHLQAYVSKRLGETVSPATVRRELVPVVAALNSAYKYFAALEDYRPPRIPRPKVSKERKTKVITRSELEKILDYLFAPKNIEKEETDYDAKTRRRAGLFLRFCLLTVSRPGEIAALKITDVDFENKIVTIRGTKTRFKSAQSSRLLPITETMRQILDERIEASKSEFVFTTGGRITKQMRRYLKDACDARGIGYGRAAPDGIIFHTARHTGATMLARSNRVDTKTAGAFTGHSDETMTLYYTHTNPQLLEIAGQVLEENFGENRAAKPAKKTRKKSARF